MPSVSVLYKNFTTLIVHNSERVSGKGYIPSVEWRDVSLIITRLEVLDQTNGFGGSTNLYDGGIDRRFVWLAFNNWDSDIEFDSIVNIYGYPVTTNDVIQGEITDSSSLVHRYLHIIAKFSKCCFFFTDFLQCTYF